MALTRYPDVSRWRPGLPLAGAPAVCCKATEGTDVTDPEYGPCKDRAGRAKILFFGFHFLRRGSAGSQAAWCYRHVGKTPLMLDVERRLDTAAGIDSKPQMGDVTGFLDGFRKLGGTCRLCYLPHWYWQDFMGSPDLKPLRDRGVSLVSSSYVTRYTDTGPGWDAYGGMRPVIWQYTDRQSFGGQTVDFNAFKGTAAQLAALVAGPPPAPPAEADDEFVWFHQPR